MLTGHIRRAPFVEIRYTGLPSIFFLRKGFHPLDPPCDLVCSSSIRTLATLKKILKP
jgi:hypothetical protein